MSDLEWDWERPSFENVQIQEKNFEDALLKTSELWKETVEKWKKLNYDLEIIYCNPSFYREMWTFEIVFNPIRRK
jgi:hypothetical protein